MGVTSDRLNQDSCQRMVVVLPQRRRNCQGAVWGRRSGGRRVAPRRRDPRPQVFCRQDGGQLTGRQRISPPAEHSDTVHAG